MGAADVTVATTTPIDWCVLHALQAIAYNDEAAGIARGLPATLWPKGAARDIAYCLLIEIRPIVETPEANECVTYLELSDPEIWQDDRRAFKALEYLWGRK